MITNEGKTYIKRYLAGQVPAIAQCIAFGLGNKAESVLDTTLQFEVGRGSIALTSYDYVDDKIIFKATVPEGFGGQVYEVGLYSALDNPLAGNFASKILVTFDSETEEWARSSDGGLPTYSAEFSRIGDDSLRLNPITGTSVGYYLNGVTYDLSGNSSADVFKVAYNVSGVIPASVQIRFKTDASNYYYFTVENPILGYHVDVLSKGNAQVFGQPNWATINSIEVVVQAATGSDATVDFDGIRIEDTDTVNPDYVLVSREVLAVPYTKIDGKTQEIEYSLNVSV